MPGVRAHALPNPLAHAITHASADTDEVPAGEIPRVRWYVLYQMRGRAF